MTSPFERVQEIARDLIGCCQGARSELENELNELGVGTSKAESEAFDEVAFICDGCGWYADADELHNETERQLCDECADDE
jgi:hypothetical protein